MAHQRHRGGSGGVAQGGCLDLVCDPAPSQATGAGHGGLHRGWQRAVAPGGAECGEQCGEGVVELVGQDQRVAADHGPEGEQRVLGLLWLVHQLLRGCAEQPPRLLLPRGGTVEQVRQRQEQTLGPGQRHVADAPCLAACGQRLGIGLHGRLHLPAREREPALEEALVVIVYGQAELVRRIQGAGEQVMSGHESAEAR